jgi:hypothetical protein
MNKVLKMSLKWICGVKKNENGLNLLSQASPALL